ncbi:MAG: hypothetical protein WCE96_11980 [Nitrososphaeraceae archaeon]
MELIIDRMTDMETVGVDQSCTVVYITIPCDPDGIIQIRPTSG